MLTKLWLKLAYKSPWNSDWALFLFKILELLIGEVLSNVCRFQRFSHFCQSLWCCFLNVFTIKFLWFLMSKHQNLFQFCSFPDHSEMIQFYVRHCIVNLLLFQFVFQLAKLHFQVFEEFFKIVLYLWSVFSLIFDYGIHWHVHHWHVNAKVKKKKQIKLVQIFEYVCEKGIVFQHMLYN